MPEGSSATAAPPGLAPGRNGLFTRVVTFGRLEVVSFFHSCVYLALLVCWLAFHSPEPETFVLGLTHGLLWIAMSLVCIVAVRRRVVPFWLAVAIAVLGGLGPFCGTAGFIYESRRRRAANPT